MNVVIAILPQPQLRRGAEQHIERDAASCHPLVPIVCESARAAASPGTRRGGAGGLPAGMGTRV
jgi:hypothetical protein